jgi:adenylate kinase family enzyme
MQRIKIVGTSGSGKTTLARELAQRLSTPHVELDGLFWQPGWEPSEQTTFRERLSSALAGETWVTDGNYFTASNELILPRADTLIWLDYSLAIVMWRVTRRTTQRLFGRTELWNGNRERLGSIFSKDSIILWALTTWGPNRRRFRELLVSPDCAHLTVIHLQSPRATRRWLERLAVAPSLPVH